MAMASQPTMTMRCGGSGINGVSGQNCVRVQRVLSSCINLIRGQVGAGSAGVMPGRRHPVDDQVQGTGADHPPLLSASSTAASSVTPPVLDGSIFCGTDDTVADSLPWPRPALKKLHHSPLVARGGGVSSPSDASHGSGRPGRQAAQRETECW